MVIAMRMVMVMLMMFFKIMMMTLIMVMIMMIVMMMNEGSKQEILSRIAQTVGACKTLMHALAISIFLCACEKWTELAEKMQATEIRCFQRILGMKN